MKKLLPWILPLLVVVWIGSTLRAPGNRGEFDIHGFGRLPVVVNGRTKPYDTVARTSLLAIQERQTVHTPDNRRLQPTEWLLDVFFKPDAADTYQVFVIDNFDLLALLGLNRDDGLRKRRFSFNQVSGRLADLQRQVELAQPVPDPSRTHYQRAVLDLRDKLILYQSLKHSLVPPEVNDYYQVLLKFEEELPAGRAALQAKQAGQPHDAALAERWISLGERFSGMQEYARLLPVPPDPGAEPTAWKKTGDALMESFAGRLHPFPFVFAGMAQTWRLQQAELFNGVVERLTRLMDSQLGAQTERARLEVRFNAAAPFYRGMILFAAAGLLGVLSWLWWPEALRKSAYHLVIVGWILTTAGLAVRMWLEGRPPVTNLYSSALYIGWGCVGLCLILEALFKNAIGAVSAGALGFITLLIAHHLSYEGDTLEMMRAVLDSNFWLATHVVAISTGYSATFLAGFLALIYIGRGVFTRSLDGETAAGLERMVYGIICFATFFSLVGTVLGGIWADQSWGRFWGWDPKENGALMIVLWNALILHARWGRLVKARGLMNLAIFGNIITAWSWFGVNMLGVGLHSYGFTDAAFFWLVVFAITQIAAIGIGTMPLDKWRSREANA